MLKRCSICEWQHQQDATLIAINTLPIYEQGMKGLQEAINQTLTIVNKNCSRCSNENIDFTLTLGEHLIIDTECLLWVQLATRLGYPDWSGKVTLSEIPTDVKINENNYILVAVIEYIGEGKPNELGHYIAYGHKIMGKWQIYDDLNKTKSPVIAPTRVNLHKKKISLLIYIKR